ncbi:hypothetical protein CHL76_02400 [Marinococcus halophilus]|uniref:DHHA1 domain-containing protein n=1 Tax=Marinococcus halophilus TaxID=1371 RepID=A0A510Y1G8_MARHA|nr:DHHA1 domain-containing protein [Marinococcus halophilus]OZT81226.1 hypothetical protein CHL76_02400 [Marinococcus halophilus]GEK57165.1 hypothetical protein MHA01_00700 [Marinococcus halophilus]
MQIADQLTDVETNGIMFTHTDLDGVGCGVLYKSGITTSNQVYFCNYGDVDDVIQNKIKYLRATGVERPQIIISDLGISEETAKMVDSYEGERLMLDHHKTNEWIAEKYEWAVVDTERSGTLLVYDFMAIPDDYEAFAKMVDDYDRWVHAYSDSKRLNRLFFAMGINRFFNRCLNLPFPERFTEVDEMILELESDRLERYIDHVSKYVRRFPLSDSRDIGIVYADSFQSELGHALMEDFNLEAVAMINPNAKSVSFRSKGTIDVGEIAKELGGGGHHNASGVSFDYDFAKEKNFPLKMLSDFTENSKNVLGVEFEESHERTENKIIADMLSDRQEGNVT